MNNDAKELKKHVQSIVGLLHMLDDNEMSCCGITLAQCHALVEIGDAGALSLGDLAGRMSLDKSTLSRTVNNLVLRGYCEREEQPDDRRYIVIRLTQAGDQLYAGVKENLDGYFEKIYNAIPREKRKQVIESVELLFHCIVKSGCCCEGLSVPTNIPSDL